MQLEVGAIIDGRVTSITKFGAFVEMPNGKTGMIHISEVAPVFVKEIRDHLTENQQISAKIIAIDEVGRVSLSIKRLNETQPPAQRPARSPRPQRFDGQKASARPSGEKPTFEEMMNKFKQDSDEKMSDLKRSMEAKRGGFSRRGSR